MTDNELTLAIAAVLFARKEEQKYEDVDLCRAGKTEAEQNQQHTKRLWQRRRIKLERLVADEFDRRVNLDSGFAQALKW